MATGTTGVARVKRVDFPFLSTLLIVFASIAIFIKHRDVLTGIFTIKLNVWAHFTPQSSLGASNQILDLLPLLAVFGVLISGLFLLHFHKPNPVFEACLGLTVVPLLIGGLLFSINQIFGFVKSQLGTGQIDAYASLGDFITCIIYLVLAAVTSFLSILLFTILHLHLLIAYIHYPIVGLLAISAISFVPEIITTVEEKQEPSKFYRAFERFIGFLFYIFFPVKPPKSSTQKTNQTTNNTATKATNSATNSKQYSASAPIGGTMPKDNNDTNETTEQPTESTSLASRQNNRSEPLNTMEKISGKLQEYVAKSGGNSFLGRFFHSTRHKYILEKQTEQEKRETEFYKAQTEKVSATTDWMKAHINLNNTAREKQRNDDQQDILDMRSKEELDIHREIYTDPEIKVMKIETEKQKIKNQLLQQQRLAAQLKNEIENAPTTAFAKEETDDSALGQKLAKVRKLQEDKRKQENNINNDTSLTEKERKEQLDSLEKTFQQEKTKIEVGFGSFEED